LIGVGQPRQPLGVIEGGERIMNGAGTYHYQQAIILSRQDLANLLAMVRDLRCGWGGTGMKCQQISRSGESLYREGAHYRVQNCHLDYLAVLTGVNDVRTTPDP
jgi:hypothetical protein